MAAQGAGCSSMFDCSNRGPTIPISLGRCDFDQVVARLGACLWRAASPAATDSARSFGCGPSMAGESVGSALVAETLGVPGTFGLVIVGEVVWIPRRRRVGRGSRARRVGRRRGVMVAVVCEEGWRWPGKWLDAKTTIGQAPGRKAGLLFAHQLPPHSPAKTRNMSTVPPSKPGAPASKNMSSRLLSMKALLPRSTPIVSPS